MTDGIVQRIERFPFTPGTVLVERRNRGCSLYHAAFGAPVARLRPNADDGRVEVLYWSLWKERWSSTGPFGRTLLPLKDALRFIASEDIFRVLI
jgi:hypothetical protein